MSAKFSIVVMQVAGTALLLALIFGIYFMRRTIRRRRGTTAGLTSEELKELQKKGLLTEQEMKLVRNAVARQFVRRQEDEKPKLETQNVKSGLEALAIEAERIEANPPAPSALPRSSPPPPPVALSHPLSTPHSPLPTPDLPLAKLDRPREAAPVESFERFAAPHADLPEHLHAIADHPRTELEDLVTAGFLTPEDMQLLLKRRGES